MDHEQLGYLGDGVYLSHDGHQFWLAVGNHENYVVALEPTVANRLIEVMSQYVPKNNFRRGF